MHTLFEKSFITPDAEPDLDILQSESTIKFSLKTIGILAVLAARVGMVNVCLSSGAAITNQEIDNSQALAIGVTNALGSTLGSGLISILSTDYLVDAITRKLSSEEDQLLHNGLSQCSRCAITIISLVAGILSQIPMAMGAYFGTVPPIPASFNAASQIADFARAAYSIHHRLTECAITPSPCSRTPAIQVLLALKEQLLIAINRLSQESDLAEFENMIQSSSSGAELLDNILMQHQNNNPPFHDTVINVLVSGIACVLIAEYFMIAFAGTQRFSNNNLPISLTAAILTSLANTDLLLRLTKNGATRARELFCDFESPSLLKTISPNWHFGLTGFGIIVSLLPWAPSIYFAKEYFPSSAQMAVGVISAVAIILCSLSATFTFKDRIITKIQAAHPSVQLQGRLNKISQVIQQTSLDQIERLYYSLSEEVQQRMIPDTSMRELLQRSVTNSSQLEIPSSTAEEA